MSNAWLTKLAEKLESYGFFIFGRTTLIDFTLTFGLDTTLGLDCFFDFGTSLMSSFSGSAFCVCAALFPAFSSCLLRSCCGVSNLKTNGDDHEAVESVTVNINANNVRKINNLHML